jgi:hypothetical protein
MRFKQVLAGLALGLMATASFGQSVITFDVKFNKLLQASGAFLPFLYDSTNDPMGLGATSPSFEITGTVTLTAVASSTYLTDPSPGISNSIVLNGSFSDNWPGVSPENNWLTHTYDNARFNLFQTGGKFANNFTLAGAQPIFIGTGANGILSDHGPTSLYGGVCPFPRGLFPPFQNCASANPALAMGDNFTVFNTGTGTAAYAGLGNLGQHDLVGGTYTRTGNGAGANLDIGHDNGLDGFYFSGQLCTPDLTPCQGQTIAPGGVVRVLMSSATSNTWYVIEGTVQAVPVPAAAWLVAPAIGLLAPWIKRRKAQA